MGINFDVTLASDLSSDMNSRAQQLFPYLRGKCCWIFSTRTFVQVTYRNDLPHITDVSINSERDLARDIKRIIEGRVG